jgi:hypothetical protein
MEKLKIIPLMNACKNRKTQRVLEMMIFDYKEGGGREIQGFLKI